SVALPVERATGALPASREAFLVAGGVTGAAFVAIAYAFDPDRAGSANMLYAIGGLYAVLGAVALFRFAVRGELAAMLRPASGDIAIGGLTAGALYGLGQLAQVWLRHSPREAWIIRVYLQVGDPNADFRLAATIAIAIIAALEELVWRGMVVRSLQVVMSARA